MCGCLLPLPRSLSIILERGFSSAPGKAMEMSVQWFPECASLRMVVFVAFSVCTIGVKLSVVVIWMQGRCSRYWFEEEYMVYLEDHGYLLPASSTIAAASTTEVPELVGKIDSLEQNLNEVKEMVGKNREGLGSCICLVCGCVNVTIFVVLAIGLVVAVLK